MVNSDRAGSYYLQAVSCKKRGFGPPLTEPAVVTYLLVVSKLDKGSAPTVVLRFPQGLSYWKMPPIPGTETILVIDDDPLVLSLTDAMLTRYGYTLLTAMSGAEALALFKNWPDVEVHLLLVDLVMPGLSGPETVKSIHELRPGVPVLYFSAYSETEALRPSYARKVPYIAKPFTSVQIIKKIREVLDESQADAASTNK